MRYVVVKNDMTDAEGNRFIVGEAVKAAKEGQKVKAYNELIDAFAATEGMEDAILASVEATDDAEVEDLGYDGKCVVVSELVCTGIISEDELNLYIRQNANTFASYPSVFVRIAAVKQDCALDQFLEDESAEVRAEVARRKYGLDTLVEDPSYLVRMAVAEQNLEKYLKILVHDDSSHVRTVVAQCGYGLEELVHDPDSYVRVAVAEQGYGYDILVKDENFHVKIAIAKHENGKDYLPRLANEPKYAVRVAVVEAGYGADFLLFDANSYVRAAAVAKADVETLEDAFDKLLDEDNASGYWDDSNSNRFVLIELAKRHVGLEKLSDSKFVDVRAAVASEGYEPDKMLKDVHWEVRKAAFERQEAIQQEAPFGVTEE